MTTLDGYCPRYKKANRYYAGMTPSPFSVILRPPKDLAVLPFDEVFEKNGITACFILKFRHINICEMYNTFK
jgi:hypothetical protein